MAIDAFLKLDGVIGESVANGHRGEIDIESYTFGVGNTSGVGRGSDAGRTAFSDVTLVALQSSATIALLQRVSRGDVITTARLTLRKTVVETSVVFATVDLRNVHVTSVNEQYGGGELPLTSFSLNFDRVTWTCTPVGANGTAGPSVTTTWDLSLQTNGA